MNNNDIKQYEAERDAVLITPRVYVEALDFFERCLLTSGGISRKIVAMSLMDPFGNTVIEAYIKAVIYLYQLNKKYYLQYRDSASEGTKESYLAFAIIKHHEAYMKTTFFSEGK